MSRATSPDVVLHVPRVRSSQHQARVTDPPIHPGAIHARMPRYYMLLDQRQIERVPRPAHLSPPQESIPAITFHAHGWPGVRVKDILKDTVVIDSANDHVFAEFGWRATVLNLEWPGYDPTTVSNPMHERINVRPNGKYMTRQELAREICGLLFNFRKHISKHPIASSWEKWALTGTRDSEGVRVTDVVLLSVHYYRTAWVPEFYVIQ